MSDETKQLPRRRWELQLKVGADTQEDMIREVERVADELRADRFLGRDVACGGVSAGYTLHISEDRTVTHESYFAAIKDL